MRRTPVAPTSLESDLEHQLSLVRDEKQAMQSDLHGMQQELSRLGSQEEARLATLQQRIGDLESEREVARRQLGLLETSLQEAAERQASNAKRIESLEGRLEREHREHRAALQEATERQASTDNRVDTLDARVEKENREQQVALQQALVREQKQNRRLNLAMGVAGFAFLLGTLAGVAVIWDARNQAGMLAELRGDIRDIKASMELQLGSIRQSLEEYRLSLLDEQTVGQPADSQSAFTGKPEEQPDRRQAESAAAVPTYGFHPHNKHRTRSEMRDFFAENARVLGVVTLDSGLQYKVLSHGNGRSPGPTDRVVYDYRAFLADGTEISNSYQEAEPAASRIDEVRPGLQEALLQMNEGAQWELYIPPGLAYKNVRKRGMGDRAFEPLIYIVELKSVIEGGEAGNEN